MSYQDPNQPGQNQGPNEYGNYQPNTPNPEQPPQGGPYSGQQYGQPGGPQPGAQYNQQQQGPYGQQQAPYGQQQTPYGQQQTPYGQQGQFGNTGTQDWTAIQPNIAAGISYIVGWIMGPIILFTQKPNRFVRFHAIQSTILAFSGLILSYVSNLIGHTGSILLLPFECLTGIIGIAFFVFWLISIINAFQGKYFKIPVIGDYAEKFANQGTTL